MRDGLRYMEYIRACRNCRHSIGNHTESMLAAEVHHMKTGKRVVDP